MSITERYKEILECSRAAGITPTAKMLRELYGEAGEVIYDLQNMLDAERRLVSEIEGRIGRSVTAAETVIVVLGAPSTEPDNATLLQEIRLDGVRCDFAGWEVKFQDRQELVVRRKGPSIEVLIRNLERSG